MSAPGSLPLGPVNSGHPQHPAAAAAAAAAVGGGPRDDINNHQKPNSSSKPAKPKNPKKYRCTYCDRAFTRSEHKSRHERSHTKEKPFHCPKCPSAFVRRDLLLRHDRTVHALRNGQPKPAREPKQSKDPLLHHSKDNKLTKDNSAKIRKRGGASAPDLDVDFNAAVLMTELQHSFHKQGGTNTSAAGNNGGVAGGAKAPPSPPTHDYLPPLNFHHHHQHQQPHEHQQHQHQHSALDLSSQVKRSMSSPQMLNPSISQHAANNNNTNNNATDGNRASSVSSGSLPPHISPQFHNNNHGGPTTGTSTFLHPIRETTGGMNYEHPIHIPQFDSSFQIGSLLKFLNEPDKSMMAQQPTRVQLNRYMSAYFTFFHPQLPFLHPPTFDPPSVAPSLLFAICSIGAVLCHENNMASSLHSNARMLVSSIYEVDKDFPNTRNTPLWATQSLILTLVYASWSGDPRGLEFISTIRTSLATIASTAFYDNSTTSGTGGATSSTGGNEQVSWKRWLNEESAKRTFFAVFVVFGALAQVYNYPTALSNAEIPLKIQLPCSEYLWNTPFNSENDWLYTFLRESNSTSANSNNGGGPAASSSGSSSSSSGSSACNIMFSQALSSLTNEQPHALPQLSPFGLRVMSVALFVEFANMNVGAGGNSYHQPHQPHPHHHQPHQPHHHHTHPGGGASSQHQDYPRDKCLAILKGWESIARDDYPGQGQLVTQIALNSTLVCLSLPMEDHMNFLFNGPSPLLSRIRTQHPLLVMGYITSMVTQVRLLVDLTSVQEMIRYHVPTDICNAALSSFTVLTTTGRLKSPQLTSLVAKCFDLYRLPCLLGLRLIKAVLSSPLITASIEGLLCGFELSLVLVMWCHRVEQDVSNGETLEEDEALLYSVIERTCFDCGLDKIQGQLAPTLAIFGADLLESVESWGLANILSLSLRSFGYSLFPQQNRMRQSPNVAAASATTATGFGGGGGGASGSGGNSGYSQSPASAHQSHPQSNLRTTASERDMFLPFKAIT